MSVEHVETLIIGAGQAGLATAYHLQLSGPPVPRHRRERARRRRLAPPVGHAEALQPGEVRRIPGLPFPAPAWSFPGKDDVANYFETYAEHFDIPVRLDTRVDRLAAHGDGYVATCGDDTIFADNVVVATGTFGRTPTSPSSPTSSTR